jgi:hypothetical protein
MAELPRLSSLQAGHEYHIPVVLKKVRKIRLVSRRDGIFSNPYFAWKIKNIQTIPTETSLRVKKSRTIRFFPRGSSFEQTDKLSVREAKPVNQEEVSRLIFQIRSSQEITDSDTLILDYILDKTFTGYPRVVLWWIPDTVIQEGIRHARGLPDIQAGVLNTNVIIADILGHKDLYAQAQGYRIDRYQILERITNQPAPPVRNLRTATESYNGIANVGTMNISRGSTNTISLDDIEEGDEMVNFHGEHGYGRYYKKSSFNQIPVTYPSRYKKNPTTRANITRNNLRKYKAHLVGGKKRRTRKH